MVNPTAITSSQESLLEQGLYGSMVIANAEHLLSLHLTSVMDLVPDLDLPMFLL